MSLKLFKTVSSKIKLMKLAKKLRINPKFFFDFLIYHFSRLFKANIDNKLIILGANSGKAFTGNPKYLYYFLKVNTDYKLYFFTKSDSLRKCLNKDGIKTIKNYSLKAIKLLRKARAVFVSHGYEDILPIKFSPRTVVVYIGHGGGIKIKGKHPYAQKYIYSKWTKILRIKLRDDDFYNFMIISSDSKKPLEITSSIFKFSIERIIPTGYPRNDILFSNDPNLYSKIKDSYKIPNYFRRIILYAPTYREKFTSKIPFMNEDLEKINEFCIETNTLFLFKAHINEEFIKFKDLSNIKEVSKDADTQELLFITDILITDYSTVYHDFLLLDRPILLYTYDYDEYVSNRGIYYDHLEEIAPGPLLYTVNELLDALKTIDRINEKYRQKRIELRKYFNKYNDGNSSKRVLKYLKLI